VTETEQKTVSRRYALVLFAVAVVAGATGPRVLPHGLVWITVGVLFWAAGTTWWRTIEWPRASMPANVEGIAVKLTLAPNVPIAEAICSRLRDNGIEAYWSRPPVSQGFGEGTGDFMPAEVWVAEQDLARAQALLEPVSDST
jgi:hypothetical protein